MFAKKLPNSPLSDPVVQALRSLPLSEYECFPNFWCRMISRSTLPFDANIMAEVTRIFDKKPALVMLLAFDSDQAKFQSAPHTDRSRPNNGVNFYIDLGGEDVYTRWWEATEPVRMIEQFVDPADYHKLQEVGCYKFSDQHWYWFNSKTLHSVDKAQRPRKILAVAFD